MPSTKETQTRIDVKEPRAGVERSEPGGRAQRCAWHGVEIGGVSPVLEP